MVLVPCIVMVQAISSEPPDDMGDYLGYHMRRENHNLCPGNILQSRANTLTDNSNVLLYTYSASNTTPPAPKQLKQSFWTIVPPWAGLGFIIITSP